VIDVGPIGQKHIGKGVSRLVAAVRLEDDFFPKHHRGRSLLGLMTVRLALLGAVDAVQADAFRVLVVEDFEGIAVEDPDDEAMILRDSGGWRGCQDSEEHTEGPNREATEGAKDEGHGSLAGRRIL
jgi:hypothetical protein